MVRKDRQTALIYGNCQTEIIANMLEYNTEFHNRYVLLRVPQIHLYRDEEQIQQIFYQNAIMQKIDLFIYQNVKESNRFSAWLGVNNIMKQMSNNCKRLCIHNIYFDGYFIQYDADDNRYFNNMNHKDFPYTDGIVHGLIKDKKNIDEILKLINDTELMPRNEILAKCQESIDNLRQRENNVDIPIVDYIEEHYRKEQLFYTYNHPKSKVIYEYAKRILETLGINRIDEFTEEELNFEFGTLRVNNFPIFPCVIEALGLENMNLKCVFHMYQRD